MWFRCSESCDAGRTYEIAHQYQEGKFNCDTNLQSSNKSFTEMKIMTSPSYRLISTICLQCLYQINERKMRKGNSSEDGEAMSMASGATRYYWHDNAII